MKKFLLLFVCLALYAAPIYKLQAEEANGAEDQAQASTAYVSNSQEWEAALNNQNIAYIILTNDITVPPAPNIYYEGVDQKPHALQIQMAEGRNLTIQGNYTITTRPMHFNLQEGALVILDGPTFARYSGAAEWTFHFIFVHGSGTFILRSGGILADSSFTNAAGVLLRGSVTFLMEGGLISGATAAAYNRFGTRAGVTLRENTAFVMTGGSITSNDIGISIDAPSYFYTVRVEFIAGDISNNLRYNFSGNKWGTSRGYTQRVSFDGEEPFVSGRESL